MTPTRPLRSMLMCAFQIQASKMTPRYVLVTLLTSQASQPGKNSMPLQLNDQSVNIPCPACGQQTAQTVGGLKKQPAFVCACGQPIRVDLTQFKKDVARANRRIRQDALKRSP
jgi:hypothetical protein